MLEFLIGCVQVGVLVGVFCPAVPLTAAVLLWRRIKGRKSQ